MLDELMDVPSLDAELPVVGGARLGRRGAHDLAVQDFENDPATARAVRATGCHKAHFHVCPPNWINHREHREHREYTEVDLGFALCILLCGLCDLCG
jgi:hypothetical protein